MQWFIGFDLKKKYTVLKCSETVCACLYFVWSPSDLWTFVCVICCECRKFLMFLLCNFFLTKVETLPNTLIAVKRGLGLLEVNRMLYRWSFSFETEEQKVKLLLSHKSIDIMECKILLMCMRTPHVRNNTVQSRLFTFLPASQILLVVTTPQFLFDCAYDVFVQNLHCCFHHIALLFSCTGTFLSWLDSFLSLFI